MEKLVNSLSAIPGKLASQLWLPEPGFYVPGILQICYSVRPNRNNFHLHLWAQLDFKFNLISGYIKQPMKLMDKTSLLKL
jgi:hypothetical protein